MAKISAFVEMEARVDDVKKYCCDRSSTAFIKGTGVGASPAASCLFRFLHDFMTAM